MLPTVGALHQNADGPPDPNSSVQESLLVFFLHFLATLHPRQAKAPTWGWGLRGVAPESDMDGPSETHFSLARGEVHN